MERPTRICSSDSAPKARLKIYFVHEGKAAYPEIAAYRSFFEGSYETQEISPQALATHRDLTHAICWCMMGFYPRRLDAACVIHDYRSLSVGAGRVLKDRIKRALNAKPDIRIFQNELMRASMGFRDGVASLLLPMGVPPSLCESRTEAQSGYDCDFCYIGVLSRERKSFVMLDSFLKRFGTTKLFHLYGAPEPELVARYAQHPSLVFKGAHPQTEVFRALRRSRVAVNYFPNHAPHIFQTPTKLLEYAALGLRILCNEQPQSRLCASIYGLSCHWGDAVDMFGNVPESLTWDTNEAFDPAPLFWPEIIRASGIADALGRCDKA